MSFLPARPFKKTALILIILAAIFFRFYNLDGSLQFQGDQGRDAIIVADIFRLKDLVFIGPVTSVGNMYLGPLYYYFMMPFLWLTYPSPMGPVYAVALLGVITTYLVYYLGRKIIGENGAIIASFFYAFSATFIQNTRFSWNPNPAPLASLLMIYFSYLAWKKNHWNWVWASVCFSVLIQLHYLTLLSLPAAGIIWLLSFRDQWQKTAGKKSLSIWKRISPLMVPSFVAVAVFLLSLTPLVLFDIKHQGNNLNAFKGLLSSEDNFKYAPKVSLIQKVGETIKENEGRGMHILFEIMIGKNRSLNRALLYFTAMFLTGFIFIKKKQKKDLSKISVILIYLLVGIVGTSLYEHTIFDHYISYLFPITALIYGLVISKIKPRLIAIITFLALASYFISYNLPIMPTRTMGWTVNDIQMTSEEILKHVQPGEKYNIVLLSESRDIDGQNYRYFLTTGHTRPVTTEERDSIDTLFIINEEKTLKKVTDSPIYEIVVFPNKEPAEVFNIPGGPEITVLRRTTQDNSQGLE